MTVRKEFGGIGFRSLYGFNLAVLGKQDWKFLSNPEAMMSRIFKARYFPRGDFLNSAVGLNSSYAWRSICNSQAFLKEGLRWRVGDGTQINVWTDPGSVTLKISRFKLPNLQPWQICALLTCSSQM